MIHPYIHFVRFDKRTAATPSEGAFYIINYGDGRGNVLEPFFGLVGHVDVWRETIVPKLINSYKLDLDPSQIDTLNESHTIFPRGRVMESPVSSNIQFGDEQPGYWYVYVASPNVYSDKVKRSIINAFGLNAMAARDAVKFVESKHEQQDPEEINFFSNLLKNNRRTGASASGMTDVYHLVYGSPNAY